jgi:hypothetical protein
MAADRSVMAGVSNRDFVHAAVTADGATDWAAVSETE